MKRQVVILVPLMMAMVLVGLLLLTQSMVVGSSPQTGVIPAGGQEDSMVEAGVGWSSGWITVPLPATPVPLTHNLGGDPDDYAVALWFADTDDGYGINMRGYGGIEDGDDYYGGYWQRLTTDTIEINRNYHDIFADMLRVWVWIPETPDYCSEWTAIAPHSTTVFTHSLGGDVDDYAVGLAFSNTQATSGFGIHHRNYGGMEDSNNWYGAFWHDLTADTVRVSRLDDDDLADEVRVCVNQPVPPDWDSGWQSVNQGEAQTFYHGLGGSPSNYVVRMDFQQGNLGIHHYGFGGVADDTNYMGANWENLTASSIDIYRHSDDSLVEQVRVRIWRRRIRVYLPIVLHNQ